MNRKTVREAADRAEDLASLVDPPSYRAAAFAVLFERLLADRVSAPRLPAHSKRDAVVKPGGSRGKGRRGPTGNLRELAGDGFFKTGRGVGATLRELADRGHPNYTAAVVGKCLQRLCREKLLRRKKGSEGGRTVYLYTNW
jgi:hypothetical protein